MISPSQRPLPDNTQLSQETGIHVPAGFEPPILASERPQTHNLVRAATGMGILYSSEDDDDDDDDDDNKMFCAG
jgi:hypothetical protein